MNADQTSGDDQENQWDQVWKTQAYRWQPGDPAELPPPAAPWRSQAVTDQPPMPNTCRDYARA